MATIGTMAVNIVARTDKFTKALNNATSGLGAFVGKITNVGNAVAGLAAYGFVSFVNEVVEAGGKLEELTNKLQISAEALTALHYAAQQLESSDSAVDMALQRMTLTLGKANQGVDAAIGAFNALGLSYQHLLRLPLEQQFLAVLDALRQMPTAADQAAAAQAIFGKGFKEITPLINAGADAIVKLGQEAVAMGAVVATDTVSALDDAGDSIAAFSAGWANLKMQVVSVAAPAIAVGMNIIASSIGAVKAIWWTLQEGILYGAELITRAIIAIQNAFSGMPLIGDWLAKDAAAGQVLVEELQRKRAGIDTRIGGMLGQGSNPLEKAPGASPAIEKNTATTATASQRSAEALEQMARARPVNISIAGVR